MTQKIAERDDALSTLPGDEGEGVGQPLRVDSQGALWVRLGVSATDIGKAEDAAHASGDTGIYALAVRDDALAAHSGTDGDYESLHTDAKGALWVRQIINDDDQLTQAENDAATQQTDTELVAAPGASTQVSVAAVYVSSDTALAVTFESSTTTRKWKQYVAANGGHVAVAPPGEFLFTCASNESLTYTTSAAGNVFVSVLYASVPA